MKSEEHTDMDIFAMFKSECKVACHILYVDISYYKGILVNSRVIDNH